jgi:hypothetical protein
MPGKSFECGLELHSIALDWAALAGVIVNDDKERERGNWFAVCQSSMTPTRVSGFLCKIRPLFFKKGGLNFYHGQHLKMGNKSINHYHHPLPQHSSSQKASGIGQRSTVLLLLLVLQTKMRYSHTILVLVVPLTTLRTNTHLYLSSMRKRETEDMLL